jgi:uncharacterized protein
MKLLIFSDIHNDWQALEKIISREADLYICLGDLSHRGQNLDQAGKLLTVLKKKLWIMPGNQETVPEIIKLSNLYGLTYFHDQVKLKNNFQLAGFGLSSPTPFNTQGELSEQVLKKSLSAFAGLKNLILFTHVPPFNTKLDTNYRGIRAGSISLKKFIEDNQPLYVFSGHVHENEGKADKIGKTICRSIGKHGFIFSLPHEFRTLI